MTTRPLLMLRKLRLIYLLLPLATLAQANSPVPAPARPAGLGKPASHAAATPAIAPNKPAPAAPARPAAPPRPAKPSAVVPAKPSAIPAAAKPAAPAKPPAPAAPARPAGL